MKAILLERLHADHYRYAALLCILDRQLHIAICQEVPDHRLLARLFHYLTRQPEEWHHDVEDRLFERLAIHHPVSRELLEVLIEEHRRIATYGRELVIKAQQQADARPDEELDTNTLNLARAFSELYHHHLYTETHQVFPLLAAHIPVNELENLTLAPLVAPAEGSPDFQQLYRQIAAGRTGLKLGHDEQADFCPLCDVRTTASTAP